MSSTYRLWAYKNEINDYGIADSFPGFGRAFVVCGFTAVLCDNPRKFRKTAGELASGCVIYEFLQPYLGTGVFNFGDVIAAVLGGTMVLIVFATAFGFLESVQYSVSANFS